MEQQVIDAVSRHPHVESIRLVGSRARGDARDESDWDFRVEVNDFDAVASALPTLLSRLDPIAQQYQGGGFVTLDFTPLDARPGRS